MLSGAVKIDHRKSAVQKQNCTECIANDIHNERWPHHQTDSEQEVKDLQYDPADRHILDFFFHLLFILTYSPDNRVEFSIIVGPRNWTVEHRQYLT